MSPHDNEATDAPAKARLDHIDGLRAIAALWVVSYHMWVRFLPSLAARGALSHAWWLVPLGWCRYGRFAVDIFIVISGFCLALPVTRAGALRGGAMTFWKKRARRILPTYYAAMLLTLPFCWLFVDWSRWFVTAKGLLLHLLLLQDVFSNNEISSVYWSIAVECHIYLLFPLLMLVWGRVGPRWSCVAGCAAGLALYWALKDTPYIGSTPQYLILFSIGMLAASISAGDGAKLGIGWTIASIVLIAGLFGLCVTGLVEWIETRLGDLAPLALDCIVGLAGAVLIVAASRSGGWLAKALGARPLALIGAFSYSLYLVHAPIHFLCMKTIWVVLTRFVPGMAAYPLFVALSIPIILAGSLAFYLLFEAPLLAPGAGGALEEFARRLRSRSPLLSAIDRVFHREQMGKGAALRKAA